VDVDLTDEERQLLSSGLAQWGGPAHATDALAVAMGFADIDDLLAESDRICALLADRKPLSSRDLARALVTTEIAFASDVFGAGVEWSIVQGLTDEETIPLLRGLQRKVLSAHAGHIRKIFDTSRKAHTGFEPVPPP